MPLKSILKMYRKAEFIQQGGVEPIQDMLNFNQRKFYGYNRFIGGKDFMWNPISNDVEEDDYTANKLKLYYLYYHTKQILAVYIDSHLYRFWASRRRDMKYVWILINATLVDLEEEYK